jgi:hypothetical protein
MWYTWTHCWRMPSLVKCDRQELVELYVADVGLAAEPTSMVMRL